MVATTDTAGAMKRISITIPVIAAARQVAFLVAGAAKAAALSSIVNGALPLTTAPAGLWRECQGKVNFLMDREAARELDLSRS